MILWGGFNLFKGCPTIIGRNLGKKYIGLLYDCEEESLDGVEAENIFMRKSIHTSKKNVKKNLDQNQNVYEDIYSLLIRWKP